MLPKLPTCPRCGTPKGDGECFPPDFRLPLESDPEDC